MLAVASDVLRQVGPFVIPVAVFALGLVGYGLILLYTRWREDGDTPKD